MALFKGAGVALITPFNADFSVNYEMLDILVDRQLEAGTDAIIVCGTTGEPATMTEVERISVIEHVTKRVKGRKPVIAGVGANSTHQVLDFIEKLKNCSIDGLLIVTPYYNKATQRGLYEHYATIAKNTVLPIIMYNVPSRTGCNLLPETAERLAREFDNIVGVKEASGNISQVAKLAKLTDGYMDIYAGNDDQIIPVLALGGAGVISVVSNIVPADIHCMVSNYLQGEVKSALDIQFKYLELIELLFCEVNPIPVKAAMNLMGYKVGGLRLPLTGIEPENEKRIGKCLSMLGLNLNEVK